MSGVISGPNGSTSETGGSGDWLQPPAEQEGLRRYVDTLRERIWIVVGLTAITTAIAILYVITASKSYEASAEVYVNPASSEGGLLSPPGVTQSTDPTRDVETAAKLISNRAVAERVKADLDSPEGIDGLLGMVTAEPVAQSQIVDVTARAGSPEEAADLANSFAEQAGVELTERVRDYIDVTLPDLLEEQKKNPSDSLEAQVAALQVKRAAPDTTLEVLTEAETPVSPVSPRPLFSVVGGIFAGIVLGIAAAFAIQVLDPRLRREEQLRRLYRLPILARIPKEQRPSSTPLDPLSLSPAASEAYRSLRGTLGAGRNSSPDSSRAILVTGSSPSEGKTTTGINLASSLAAAGASVILIESDLRRPSIGRALDVKPTHGVVSVLIESVPLEEALVTTEAFGSNLGLLLADYEGGWISELFALPAARELITEARELADYVIIDSPPLTDVVDALPLARYVDDVLMVVRIGRTQLSKLQQLGELLAENDIRPTGFAVVGVPRPARSDYHYYGARAQRPQLKLPAGVGRDRPPENPGVPRQ